MTLQEAKDQIAQKTSCKGLIHGQMFYKDWGQMEYFLKERRLQDWVISRMHEAAELYQSTVNKELREEVERLKAEMTKGLNDIINSAGSERVVNLASDMLTKLEP